MKKQQQRGPRIVPVACLYSVSVVWRRVVTESAFRRAMEGVLFDAVLPKMTALEMFLYASFCVPAPIQPRRGGCLHHV